MEKSTLLPEYVCGSSTKRYALVILFPDPKSHSDNIALGGLKEKIEKSFENVGFEVLSWLGYDLKKTKRSRFMDDIVKLAKDLPTSESFAMVVICSQKKGKIQMTSGDEFEMEDVYLKFTADSCQNLKCKPKLFIFDTHPYEIQRKDAHQSSKMPQKIPEFSGKVPLEADMLVVYSIEGNTDNPKATTMVSPNPSFINALAEVMENDFKKENGHKDVLELMVDASDRVLLLNGPDSPIPMVLSTLTGQYYLKNISSEQ